MDKVVLQFNSLAEVGIVISILSILWSGFVMYIVDRNRSKESKLLAQHLVDTNLSMTKLAKIIQGIQNENEAYGNALAHDIVHGDRGNKVWNPSTDPEIQP